MSNSDKNEKAAGKVEEDGPVSIKVMTKYCRLFEGIHSDLVQRIFKGVDIDVGGKHPYVNRHQYFTLYSILKYMVASMHDLLHFWRRVLDPQSIQRVSKREIL